MSANSNANRFQEQLKAADGIQTFRFSTNAIMVKLDKPFDSAEEFEFTTIAENNNGSVKQVDETTWSVIFE